MLSYFKESSALECLEEVSQASKTQTVRVSVQDQGERQGFEITTTLV
jgi:hypothetical protein